MYSIVKVGAFMTILAQLVTSFFAASGFAVVFNAPRRSLWLCGLVGMSGWIIYYPLMTNGVDVVGATAVAAIVVGIFSQICARVYKTPVIIFNVAGIIPLVPGGIAYNAMRSFVEDNYNVGIELSARVMLLSGAIAIGLIFSEVINQLNKKYILCKKTKQQKRKHEGR